MGRIEGRRSSWRWCPPLKGRVADLGAGWGYLSGEILAEQEGIAHLDLIEADHDMLEAARANVDDPRAAFHWADVTRFDPGGAL
jgi:16S rRNA (guanine1207-N2)-methyltransferase